MIPTEQQKGFIDRIVAEPTHAALVNADTGLGKTALGLWVSERVGVKVILVVAPLNTEDGWQRHAELLRPDLPWRVLDSSPTGKSNFDALKRSEPGVYYITRTYFALVGSSTPPKAKPDGTFTKGRAQLVDWRKYPKHIDMVISDEAHESSNRDAKAHRQLMYLKTVPWKLALSATPSGNRFDRLWETTRWLWPDLIDRSKNRWMAQWCTFKQNPFNFSGLTPVGEKNPGEFVKTLPCYITGTAGKVPVRAIKVTTPMTQTQKDQYKQLKEHTWLDLERGPLIPKVPVAVLQRLRQIALGEVSFNESMEIDFELDCESSKIKAAKMIQARHPAEPILFLTDSRKFAEVAAKRLGAEVWHGGVSKAKRADLKARFLTGEIKYIVAVIQAFGVGTDGMQHACHIEVWFNRTWGDDVKNKQAEGRLNRTGQPHHEVVRYELVAPDSGDTEDLEALFRKRRRLERSL